MKARELARRTTRSPGESNGHSTPTRPVSQQLNGLVEGASAADKRKGGRSCQPPPFRKVLKRTLTPSVCLSGTCVDERLAVKPESIVAGDDGEPFDLRHCQNQAVKWIVVVRRERDNRGGMLKRDRKRAEASLRDGRRGLARCPQFPERLFDGDLPGGCRA